MDRLAKERSGAEVFRRIYLFAPLAGAVAALCLIWRLELRERIVTVRGFDLAIWNAEDLAVRIHAVSALCAFALGAVLLLRRKGDGSHRRLGWLWAGLMASVAISSLFISEINPGGYSLIHILTGVTLVTLPLGLSAARRKRTTTHSFAMLSLYLQALIIAGLFTLLPGRLMSSLFVTISD